MRPHPGERRRARIARNEAAALDALRQIAAAQAAFQALGVVDVNADGVGEYGMLRELTGAAPTRTAADGTGGTTVLAVPLLPKRFIPVGASGWTRGPWRFRTYTHEAVIAGYRFRMILPATGWTAVIETGAHPYAGYAFSSTVDSVNAERAWCCYAWPDRFGVTGRRTLLADPSGTITSTVNRTYSGPAAISPLNAGAGYATYLTIVMGPPAIHERGSDGGTWGLESAAEGIVVRRSARGTLEDTALGDPVSGVSEVELVRFAGESRETIVITPSFSAWGEYRYTLTSAAGDVSMDLGLSYTRSLQVERASLPEGYRSLAEFGGGRVEMRPGYEWSTRSLRGTIPVFPSAAQPDAGDASDFHLLGRWPLIAAANSPAERGHVDVLVMHDADGTRRRLGIRLESARRPRGPLLVVAIDPQGGEQALGFLRRRGTIDLDTARGETLPAGGWPWIAG